jgi:hypothetical protein
MPKNLFALAGSVVIAVTLALGSGPALAQAKKASAKKQLTYEQAWETCKKFVDMGVWSWDQTQQRYARGAACMKKYGYKI